MGKYLSVCGSGLRDPITYSLWGGGVPYPEHRLHWYLESVPIFRFLCFPSVMVWSLPFPPSTNNPGSLFYKHLARLLSLFILSASSLPVSVYSADNLQRLVPTLSVPHCPSVGKLPTLRLSADQCPLLVS